MITWEAKLTGLEVCICIHLSLFGQVVEDLEIFFVHTFFLMRATYVTLTMVSLTSLCVRVDPIQWWGLLEAVCVLYLVGLSYVFKVLRCTRKVMPLTMKTICCLFSLATPSFTGEGPKAHLRKLAEYIRWSYGAGIVLRLGNIARLELNYCIPMGVQSGDRYVRLCLMIYSISI